ncbi:MAG TPA: hypothetical protein VGW57_08850 [Chthoniobacterales bacterium]|nr:hypothetical protein [Chthoniobacterales bacterium]
MRLVANLAPSPLRVYLQDDVGRAFSVKRSKPVLPDSAHPLLNPQEPRSTTLDPGEVGAIQQWIRQNDPSLDQIESRADAKGR